jgi:hypothetical protein
LTFGSGPVAQQITVGITSWLALRAANQVITPSVTRHFWLTASVSSTSKVNIPSNKIDNSSALSIAKSPFT